MSTLNDFLPFCPVTGASNLLTEAEYLAASDRTNGNQPGVASSKLNNKALRQANAVVSQFAQTLSNLTNTDVLDDANFTKLLAQMTALMTPLPPVVTAYTASSGTHYVSYQFFIASGNATTGATYTNNAFTFTVVGTIAAGLKLVATGTGAPSSSGVLTKTGGTGDATITFYAVRKAIAIQIEAAGSGGGGGSGTGAGTGTAGNNTTFGGATCSGGGAGQGGSAGTATGGAGGSATLAAGMAGVAVSGTDGASGMSHGALTVSLVGGMGGFNPLAGAGAFDVGATGGDGKTNTGGGGAGGSPINSNTGAGGGGGGYIRALIAAPAASYAYAVGAAASGEASGGGADRGGGTGAAGLIIVTEIFQ